MCSFNPEALASIVRCLYNPNAYGSIAQLVEQIPLKDMVGGSNPSAPTKVYENNIHYERSYAS